MQYLKTKLVIFHYHRANPKCSSIHINACFLNENPCLETLLKHKVTPIVNIFPIYDAGIMAGSLYRSSKYLPDHMRDKRIAVISLFFRLDGVQKRLHVLVSDELFPPL